MRAAHVMMMINAAAHYASLAMLDLALRADSGCPVRAADITQRNGIPGPYLLQILRTLKAHGWVHATRGSQGGYQLAVDADSISLLEIVEAIGGAENSPSCDDADHAPEAALQQCWQDAADASRRRLARVRLGDLVRQCQDQDAAMFYI